MYVVHTSMHVWISHIDHTYVCMYVHMYVRMYVRTYVRMYVCTYVHTYVQRNPLNTKLRNKGLSEMFIRISYYQNTLEYVLRAPEGPFAALKVTKISCKAVELSSFRDGGCSLSIC